MAEYDICLSFASEQRSYVEQVADILRLRAVKVFYDRYEQAALWGKDLYVHLDHVYRSSATYCVVFVSKEYASKVWTGHERASAQARALVESNEYFLPVRFDDTEIPGLRPTTAYLEASAFTPDELAEVICQKLQLPSSNESDLAPRWFDHLNYSFMARRQQIVRFQNRLLAGNSSAIDDFTEAVISQMAARVVLNDGQSYWTTAEDRQFDRLYITSSVCVALLHAGISVSHRAVEASTAYLSDSDPSSVDDRAASIFLLTSGQLDAAGALAFVRMVSGVQNSDDNSTYHGSFLLPQGPSQHAAPRSNWSNNNHADGASFHACHLADALLHIPVQFSEARAEAVPILHEIRAFLVRSFVAHDGWLVSLTGERTPLTTFSYALAPRMAIPLPKKWRENAYTIMNLLQTDRYGPITRCFGVMNASYLHSTTLDTSLLDRAREFAQWFLDRLPGEIELRSWSTVDLAALLRAVVYGVAIIDPDGVTRLAVSTTRAADRHFTAGGI